MRFFKIASFAACLGLVLGATQAVAQDYELGEIVISANKIETPVEQTGQTVNVVSEQTIEDLQLETVREVLQRVPGIYVVNAPAGTNIYIRGSKDYMTQVRYDDFPLYDASAMNGGFSTYTGYLLNPALDLNRVEVLKNSAGSLYGSSATAGVVSMFSQAKWNSGTQLLLSPQYGSYNTWAVNGSASYGNDKYYLSFSPMFEISDGYLDNWYRRGGFNLGAGLRLNNETSVEFVALGLYDKSLRQGDPGYDPNTGTVTPPPHLSDDNYYIHQFGLAGLTVRHALSEKWDMRFKFGTTYANREYYSDVFGYEGSEGNFFVSNTVFAEWLNNIILNENFSLLAGLDGEGDKMSREIPANPSDNVHYSNATFSVFGKLLGSFVEERLNLSAGGRVNYNDLYGLYGTFDFSAAYYFAFGLKTYASLSSGYQTPSGLQVLYPWGNSNFDLQPEKSLGLEFGLEQSLFAGKLLLGVAIFRTNYRDMIDYDWMSDAYVNRDEGKSRGFELSASLMPNQYFSADLAYSYANTEFSNAGGPWTRQYNIPQKLLSGALSVYPLDGLVLSAMVNWQSETMYKVGYYLTPGDWSSWTSVDCAEPAFLTVNLAASYDINQHFTVFGKINNLFNKEYTIQGYPQPGVNFRVGLEVRW